MDDIDISHLDFSEAEKKANEVADRTESVDDSEEDCDGCKL
ncbi:hypothetical protein [Enterobacter sp. 18A13]|nr:hypothetical protein [Enterobacter sp. 18A13]